MKLRFATILALLLWLGTLLLIIPVQLRLPKAMTIAGFTLVMYAPMSWLNKTELYFVAEYSYWIGLTTVLIASGLLVLVSGRSKRAIRLVGIIDLIVIASSLLTAILIQVLEMAS